MKRPLRLLAICNYPTDTRPAHQVFVRALLVDLATQGVDVTVVAPEPLSHLSKAHSGYRLAPRYETRDGILIRRPRYVRYSSIGLPFGGTTRRWSDSAHVRAVARAVKTLDGPFDVCYGHFLYPHGVATAYVGEQLNIPAVVSLGESTFDRYAGTYGDDDMGQLLARFAGIVVNSALIKDFCVQRLGRPEESVVVLPNGVNEQVFFPREREMARQYCRLPADRPVVAFVGQLIERKGPLRVLEAIRPMPDVGAIFLGQGPQVPDGPQVLYQGTVPHDDVPIWLSAADLFVLPTLDEGCSNAILEALSCGLPVVSSDRPFNHAILDDEMAVLIDPLDVKAIGQAIGGIIDSPGRRAAMSEAALRRASSFRLKDRAARIRDFLSALC